MSKGIFIVGTGTDVGKTYVSGLLVKNLRKKGINAGYFKAAASGNLWEDGKLVPGDAALVNRISGMKGNLDEMIPYVYERAVSPHLASQLEGNPVSLDVVKECYYRISQKHEYMVVEGSGGVLCPIRYDEQKIWQEDIIKLLNLDTLLVADAGLGTINGIGLSAYYMKSRQIKVKGILMNRCHPGNQMEQDNIKMVEELTGIPVIAQIEEGDQELAFLFTP
ncbi:MAG: dethiobiotin synthase [Lachnospira sp.]|nr:dethiobiotin synthase [Lachnospira sp.]